MEEQSSSLETIADLTNQRLKQEGDLPAHHFDEIAESDAVPKVSSPASMSHLPKRDPSLPSKLLKGYYNFFVDNFIALVQGCKIKGLVHRILLRTIDSVFRPLEDSDNPNCQEPVSLKNLRKEDCSWFTKKKNLGWILDTTAKTIHLPKHQVDCLAEILNSIPSTQKQIFDQ